MSLPKIIGTFYTTLLRNTRVLGIPPLLSIAHKHIYTLSYTPLPLQRIPRLDRDKLVSECDLSGHPVEEQEDILSLADRLMSDFMTPAHQVEIVKVIGGLPERTHLDSVCSLFPDENQTINRLALVQGLIPLSPEERLEALELLPPLLLSTPTDETCNAFSALRALQSWLQGLRRERIRSFETLVSSPMTEDTKKWIRNIFIQIPEDRFSLLPQFLSLIQGHSNFHEENILQLMHSFLNGRNTEGILSILPSLFSRLNPSLPYHSFIPLLLHHFFKDTSVIDSLLPFLNPSLPDKVARDVLWEISHIPPDQRQHLEFAFRLCPNNLNDLPEAIHALRNIPPERREVFTELTLDIARALPHLSLPNGPLNVAGALNTVFLMEDLESTIQVSQDLFPKISSTYELRQTLKTIAEFDPQERTYLRLARELPYPLALALDLIKDVPVELRPRLMPVAQSLRTPLQDVLPLFQPRNASILEKVEGFVTWIEAHRTPEIDQSPLLYLFLNLLVLEPAEREDPRLIAALPFLQHIQNVQDHPTGLPEIDAVLAVFGQVSQADFPSFIHSVKTLLRGQHHQNIRLNVPLERLQRMTPLERQEFIDFATPFLEGQAHTIALVEALLTFPSEKKEALTLFARTYFTPEIGWEERSQTIQALASIAPEEWEEALPLAERAQQIIGENFGSSHTRIAVEALVPRVEREDFESLLSLLEDIGGEKLASYRKRFFLQNVRALPRLQRPFVIEFLQSRKGKARAQFIEFDLWGGALSSLIERGRFFVTPTLTQSNLDSLLKKICAFPRVQALPPRPSQALQQITDIEEELRDIQQGLEQVHTLWALPVPNENTSSQRVHEVRAPDDTEMQEASLAASSSSERAAFPPLFLEDINTVELAFSIACEAHINLLKSQAIKAYGLALGYSEQ